MKNTFCAYALVAGGFALGTAYAADDKDALIKDALSAASPEIAKTAMVMDWDHSMLKQGNWCLHLHANTTGHPCEGRQATHVS